MKSVIISTHPASSLHERILLANPWYMSTLTSPVESRN